MSPRPSPPAAPAPSLARTIGQPAVLLAGLALVAAYGTLLGRRSKAPTPPPVAVAPAVVASPSPAEPPAPAPVAVVAPVSVAVAIPAPTLDREAVARAEEGLNAAKSDRARAEGRARKAEEGLAEAKSAAAKALATADATGEGLKAPTGRIREARTRAEAIRSEAKALESDVARIEGTPRPGKTPLIDQSPVARAAEGKEYHFEVRRDRVSYINLDRLMEQVKADVRLQARLLLAGKPAGGTVGPIGDFSLHYEVGVEMPDTVEGLMQGRGSASYQLRGWELVADRDRRGETFESTRHPASEYARAIQRLSPARATITMWVYPDGFGLYRLLRDELHARGFLVAARPLPEGVSIQGSPGGSKSAGQ